MTSQRAPSLEPSCLPGSGVPRLCCTWQPLGRSMGVSVVPPSSPLLYPLCLYPFSCLEMQLDIPVFSFPASQIPFLPLPTIKPKVSCVLSGLKHRSRCARRSFSPPQRCLGAQGLCALFISPAPHCGGREETWPSAAFHLLSAAETLAFTWLLVLRLSYRKLGKVCPGDLTNPVLRECSSKALLDSETSPS